MMLSIDGRVPLTTIIPWCDRPELRRTLAENAAIFADMCSDVVVVNCGGDATELRTILESVPAVGARPVDLAAPFNRSLAINIGIHHAAPGVVFVLDADILLSTSLRRHADRCADGRYFGILAGMKTEPPREGLFRPPPGVFLHGSVAELRELYYWSDGRVTNVILSRLDSEQNRSACGIVLVERRVVLEIGGYRSDFPGWGWEDIDLQVRLLRKGIESFLVPETITHLEHDNAVRDLHGATPRDSAARNRAQAWRDYCRGHFHGTYETDVQRWLASCAGPPPLTMPAPA
jgi:hypothetical protein